MEMSKTTMINETKTFIKTLFTLAEVEKVAIKDINIISDLDDENIMKGFDKCFHDIMSDVDINIWIKLSIKDFSEETPIYKKLLPRLGIDDRIFGVVFQSRTDANIEGLRIVLDSGFRMDLTCFVCCNESTADLPKENIRKHITVKQETNISENWDIDKANSFWFVSIQALAKLYRHDYLIADHLTHMLLMESLVVQMVDRDNKYQTNFHRYGYSEELQYKKVDVSMAGKYFGQGDETFNYIAENLYRAIMSYDKLVGDNNPIYEKRVYVFLEIWDNWSKKFR